MPLKELLKDRYKPKTYKDIVLLDRIDRYIHSKIKEGNINNLLLSGKPGLGKTTLANIIVNEVDGISLFINGSLDSGIDSIRNDVINFVSHRSLQPKFVIIDEVDGLSNSAQNSLKSLIERYQNSTRFIFTTNSGERVIEPLKSRLAFIDFDFNNSEEKIELFHKYYERIEYILKKENIEYIDDNLKRLIVDNFPDMRKIIDEVEHFTVDGVLDYTENHKNYEDTISNIFRNIDNFEELHKIVYSLKTIQDIEKIFILLSNRLNYIEDSDLPSYISIISKYMYQHKHTISKQVNLLSCLIEINSNCKIKTN